MKVLRMFLLLQTMLVLTPALAERYPDSFPDRFSGAGTVDGMNPANRTMVVGDRLLGIADHVRVHGRNGANVDLARLRKGMEIGYSTGSTGRDGSIMEIWILPDGYLSSLGDAYRF